MPSFKAGAFVCGERQPAYNALRFATREEAETYGRDLAGRWMLVERIVVEESTDPVNYQWVDGHGLVFIESTKTAEA
jgi:hypothetical protein